jgi:hypothetical protein
MTSLLEYFADHRAGITVLFASAFALALLVQWVCWIFALGRFARTAGAGRPELRVVITDFFVKIIDDFKHLLALVLVLIFMGTLMVMTWPGIVGGDAAKMESALKAVVASLGGIIGTIIGYYFGESAGSRRAPETRSVVETREQTPQMPPPTPGPPPSGPAIRKAPSPPPRAAAPKTEG